MGRHADEVDARHELEELALRGGRERAAHLVERSLQGAGEGQEAHLGRPVAERDQERRLPRREVDRGQRVGAVERVAAAAAAICAHRQPGVAQAVEVAIDGAHGDLEALGHRLGGYAQAARPQIFGDGEQALPATHPLYMT